MSPSIFFEGPQKSSIFLPEPDGSGTLSGLIFLSTQTASSTSLTPAGGDFIDFTRVISYNKDNIMISWQALYDSS